MVTTVTEVLNVWNEMGVFSYVIPFLLIFAVVFAILKKTKILGDDNDGILAIISVALGLLSLQFDFVSEFYAIIFPRFGVGLSLFLVLLIFVGFFFDVNGEDSWKLLIVFGLVIGIGTVVWSLGSWSEWVDIGIGAWLSEYIWSIIVLVVTIMIIVVTVKGGSGSSKPKKGGG